MKRISQAALLRWNSRVEVFADRALVRGVVVVFCIAVAAAAASMLRWTRIESGLIIAWLAVLAVMFGSVALWFLIDGYARFRARARKGRTGMAYVGLVLAVVAASFFAWVAVSGFVAFFLRGGRGGLPNVAMDRHGAARSDKLKVGWRAKTWACSESSSPA